MEIPTEKKIKLTPEQILSKQVALENTIQQIEISELTIKQFERMLASDFLINQTKDMINKEKDKIKMAKHNIIALRQHIDTGEM